MGSKSLEKKIINSKINQLDEFISIEEYDIEYLKNLNTYLLKDFCRDDEIGLKELPQYEIQTIDDNLKLIKETCIYNSECEEGITNLIMDVYNIRPFLHGNAVTLYYFLHILNKKYSLNLKLDIDTDKMNIHDSSSVNQKRLTKYKNSGIII